MNVFEERSPFTADFGIPLAERWFTYGFRWKISWGLIFDVHKLSVDTRNLSWGIFEVVFVCRTSKLRGKSFGGSGSSKLLLSRKTG